MAQYVITLTRKNEKQTFGLRDHQINCEITRITRLNGSRFRFPGETAFAAFD